MNERNEWHRYEPVEGGAEESKYGEGESDNPPTAPVAATSLFTSTMLEMNNSDEPETSESTTSSPRGPNIAITETLEQPPENSPPSATIESEDDKPDRVVNSASANNQVTSSSTPFPNISFVSNVSNPFHKLTGAAKNIKHIAHIGEEAVHVIADYIPSVGYKDAVNVIADFIPAVGYNWGGKHCSRVNRTRRTIELNVDELATYPLHKACALSATSTKSSGGGGDLKTIHQLVEEDPTQLQMQLPTTGCTPLHIAIRFGAMKWNQMLHYKQRTSNLDVIEYLIETEIEMLRRKAVQQRKKDGDDTPISLESLILDSAVYKRDANQDLPIHIAAAEGFIDAIKILLRFDNNSGFESIVIPGGGGNLPLHLAVMRDDLFLVKILLAADGKREEQKVATSGVHSNPSKACTIFKPNSSEDIPLHLALPSPLKIELWDALLQVDELKETLHIRNVEGLDAFHFFLDQPSLFKKQNAFVETHLAQAILRHLLSGKRLEPWDDHLKRSVAKSREMQQMMNNAAANRFPVMIFMADFYAHAVTILALFRGTNFYIEGWSGDETEWLAKVFLTVVVYFAAREFIQLLLSKSLYWSDYWNYLDLVRVCMLVLLARMLQRDGKDLGEPDEAYTAFLRQFLVALSCFIFMGFLSFLRVTYLQFALFVGGTAAVVVAIIPFMVTSVLVLGAFAYGFWVGGFVSSFSNTVQGYGWWVLELFMTAMNGPESLVEMDDGYISKNVWTVLFIILAQVLLLNVLIAVITSEWGEINIKQNEVFWKYRLEYAAGILPMEYFLREKLGDAYLYRCISSVAALIDSLESKPFQDSINWNVMPYSKVAQHPFLYWDKKKFERAIIDERRASQENRRKWPGGYEEGEEVQLNEFSDAWNVMHSFEADSKFATSRVQRIYIRVQRIVTCLLWCVSFMAGFLTLGFCWPRTLRRFFCAPSTTSIKTPDETTTHVNPGSTLPDISFLVNNKSSSDSTSVKTCRCEALERKIDEMKDSIATLQETVEALLKLQ